jgi:hypothetical protein
MPWIIDKDHLAEPGDRFDAVGTAGPHDYKGDGSELKCRFRMLDDDGELIYEGRCSEDDSDVALEPLEGFGMPNAGCTTIQYWVAGKGWKNLN